MQTKLIKGLTGPLPRLLLGRENPVAFAANAAECVMRARVLTGLFAARSASSKLRGSMDGCRALGAVFPGMDSRIPVFARMRVECARCGNTEDETYEFDMPFAKSQAMKAYEPASARSAARRSRCT